MTVDCVIYVAQNGDTVEIINNGTDRRTVKYTPKDGGASEHNETPTERVLLGIIQQMTEDHKREIAMYEEHEYIICEKGEPFFVLLGRDPQAPTLVAKWAHMRAKMEDTPKVQDAFRKAYEMVEWKGTHPDIGLSKEIYDQHRLGNGPEISETNPNWDCFNIWSPYYVDGKKVEHPSVDISSIGQVEDINIQVITGDMKSAATIAEFARVVRNRNPDFYDHSEPGRLQLVMLAIDSIKGSVREIGSGWDCNNRDTLAYDVYMELSRWGMIGGRPHIGNSVEPIPTVPTTPNIDAALKSPEYKNVIAYWANRLVKSIIKKIRN